MPPEEFEEVLRRWFPRHLSDDYAAMVCQFEKNRECLIAASRSPPGCVRLAPYSERHSGLSEGVVALLTSYAIVPTPRASQSTTEKNGKTLQRRKTREAIRKPF
jgi:hypothetical protein